MDRGAHHVSIIRATSSRETVHGRENERRHKSAHDELSRLFWMQSQTAAQYTRDAWPFQNGPWRSAGSAPPLYLPETRSITPMSRRQELPNDARLAFPIFPMYPDAMPQAPDRLCRQVCTFRNDAAGHPAGSCRGSRQRRRRISSARSFREGHYPRTATIRNAWCRHSSNPNACAVSA